MEKAMSHYGLQKVQGSANPSSHRVPVLSMYLDSRYAYYAPSGLHYKEGLEKSAVTINGDAGHYPRRPLLLLMTSLHGP